MKAFTLGKKRSEVAKFLLDQKNLRRPSIRKQKLLKSKKSFLNGTKEVVLGGDTSADATPI